MDGTMARNYNRDLFKHIEELQREVASLRAELAETRSQSAETIAELRDRVRELEAENASLREENQRLLNDNIRLKRILNNNSKNSSLPPSTDQKPSKAVNKYNSRTSTGRKPGAQPGHEGTTLTRESIQTLIDSRKCVYEIMDIGNPSNRYVERFIVDIMLVPRVLEVRIHADENGKYVIPKEYAGSVTYGAGVKSMCLLLHAQGNVPGLRACEILSGMTGGLVNLSEGTFHNVCQQFAADCAPAIEDIKTELMNSEVLYTDATNVTVNGMQEYIRNQSTPDAVLYSPMQTKSAKELEQTGIIGCYTGIMVHDHETALYQFGTGHAECGAHILRYLRKNLEETGHSWNSAIMMWFRVCNWLKKKLIEEDGVILGSTPAMTRLSAEYDQILAEGRLANGRLPDGDTKDRDRALLHRLAKYKDNHLLFAYREDVDFTNNLSERDLRKCKNRQKISGGFRNQNGKSCYCIILSIIETAKRKTIPFLQVVGDILSGKRVFALT